MFGKSVLIYVDPVYIVFGKIAQKFAFEIRIENVGFLSSRARPLSPHRRVYQNFPVGL